MIGETLGNYRVVRELGRGGMAAVFVAEHVHLGHEVAVKLLHPRYGEDDAMRARFLNEARTVARLVHPSICRLHDFGYTADGRGYIVMELLAGQSLRDRMEAGPLSIGLAVELAGQVAGALSVAHAGGVVHRDLKPDNLFLVDDPKAASGCRAVVLDFGIAKQVALEPRDAELTGSGFLVGTPAYMSPEQCRGTDQLDGRSDIYSLGVVLYRMVTGRLPFDAEGTGELVGQHIYVDPPPPSRHRPDLPAPLTGLIMRCLAKDPADRYPTADALAASLARLGSGEETPRQRPASPPASGTEPTEPARPSREQTAVERPVGKQTSVDPPAIVPTAVARLRADDEVDDEPPLATRRWPAVIAVGLLLAGAAGGAYWLTRDSSPAPVPALSLAADASAPSIDASPGDAGDAGNDAGLADAGPDDAPPYPSSGRELAEFAGRAVRLHDYETALAACTAGVLFEEIELVPCITAACQQRDPARAHLWYSRLRSNRSRTLLQRICRGFDVDPTTPPPRDRTAPGRDDLERPF